MIFTAKQLREKCQEQNVDLYMMCVELTKAFEPFEVTGLCYGTNTVQHDVFCHAHGCFQVSDTGFPM